MSFRSLLVTAYVAAALADILTTYIGLQNGLYENNPIAVGLMDPHGFIGLVAAKLLIAGIAYAVIWYAETVIPDEALFETSLTFLASLWSFVSVWNLWLIMNFT